MTATGKVGVCASLTGKRTPLPSQSLARCKVPIVIAWNRQTTTAPERLVRLFQRALLAGYRRMQTGIASRGASRPSADHRHRPVCGSLIQSASNWCKYGVQRCSRSFPWATPCFGISGARVAIVASDKAILLCVFRWLPHALGKTRLANLSRLARERLARRNLSIV